MSRSKQGEVYTPVAHAVQRRFARLRLTGRGRIGRFKRPSMRRAIWPVLVASALAGAACGGVSPDSRTEPAAPPAAASAATTSAASGAVEQKLVAPTPDPSGKPPMALIRPLAPSLTRSGTVATPPPVEGSATQSPDVDQPATAIGGWQRTTVTALVRTVAVRPTVTVAVAPHAPVYSGVATYYGWDFQGLPTASGPPFDMNDATITASNLWPLGTRLRVWRVLGGPWDATLGPDEQTVFFGHSIIVTVVDRGLFVHALDLSYAAFAQLGRITEGVIAVYMQPVP